MNTKEFEKLYKDHALKLRNYLRGRIREEDVDDVLQEIFCLAWMKREILEERENPAGWLHKTAKYKILERNRRYEKEPSFLDEDQWDLIWAREDWKETQSMTEWYLLFEQNLDARECRIIQAICVESRNLAETARRERIPKESLRRHFRKALEKLRRILEQQHGL